MSLLERRYAEGFLRLSVQSGTMDGYQDELTSVSEIYQSEHELRAFLLSPENDIRTKKRFLADLFGGKVEQNTLHFLMLLLDKDRIQYLPGICREYTALADERRNTLNITIWTAIPLEQHYIDSICEKFKSLFHSAFVKAAVETDPSLIGGIKVAVGDKLYDGTIKGKLSRLQSVLNG